LHGSHTFSKQDRLQYGYEFRLVYEQGRKVVGKLAVLYVRNAVARSVGFVTSRAIGGAVARNRARRILREAYRAHKQELRDDVHMVIVARTAIRGKKVRDVEADLLELWRTAGLMAGTK
jgi:ribonuclease P protein component